MSNSPATRSTIAHVMLRLVPPLIRESLLGDAEFCDEFSIKRDPYVVFDDSGRSIQRSELYDAIRQALSGNSDLEVIDTEGETWRLSVESEENQLPNITLANNDYQVALLPHVMLSSDREERLHSVHKLADDFNLPVTARTMWRNTVSRRPLENNEVDEFFDDFSDTPIHISRSIGDEFKNGSVSVSSLVPHSRRYYNRLVGEYGESESIRDYAAGAGRQFFARLSSWQPSAGFLFSLLLSSHSSLTSEIKVEHLEGEDLVRAYDAICGTKDRISQLGAIEVGLRVLPDRLEIQPALVRLIRQIRDDDPDGSSSGFRLLSALFILVDGELSRTRLLSTHPPFYRRLASLSHAALICRHFEDSDEAADSFCKWAVSSRAGRHYLQSLADMRLEPRWYPNYSEAAQIKANFFGRIVIAASEYEKNIRGDELYDLILGEGIGSIHSLCEVPRVYFPGPLEGTESSLYIMPPELSEAIKSQLGAEKVSLSSFTALLNSVPTFHPEVDKAEIVDKVRALEGVLFAEIQDKSQLLYVMLGLSSLAAVTRNHALADELRILARKCRQNAQYSFSVEEDLMVNLVAAASRENLNDWREFVGNCLTELAFGDLEDRDSEILHTHLRYLCDIVPELWASSSRADAALKAFSGR